MPEGDTVFRTARALRDALAGQELTRSDIRVPRHALTDWSGQVVDEVVSRGKHLLIRTGDQTLHTHLKMEGAWHVYRIGERWRKPAHTARAVLETANAQAVGFSLGITEVIPRSREPDVVGHLGPDLLGDDWDARRAVENLRSAPDRAVGAAILDQRNLAGIGNEYRAELCFLRGIRPHRAVSQVDDLAGFVDLAHRTIVANCDRVARTFTGDVRPGRRTWVYGRVGRPCRRCGTPIEGGSLGVDARSDTSIYVCPRCQR